jgi:ATP-binding cassette, subfamily B, bacterial
MSVAPSAGSFWLCEVSALGKRQHLVGRKIPYGGHELNIGEWQKVSFARAVLRDSQILILDEPTSAMDARAEAELFERFHELAQRRMAILTSHRLFTVKMADRIFVVDHGRIVEWGIHDELMQQQGLYAMLFLIQASIICGSNAS